MKPVFFDAHTHAQFAAFADDRDEVIRRALEEGVGMVNVGTQKDTSRIALEVAHAYEHEPVYATVGLHPIHTDASFHDKMEFGAAQGEDVKGFTSRGEIFDATYYRTLALDPKVVAIGECGLDYATFVREQSERLQKRVLRHVSELSWEDIEKRKEKQKQAFFAQIQLAYEVKKPLMIHCRNAFNNLIEILIHNSKFLIPGRPGIIHFFSGSVGDAEALLQLGFSFTFGGVITFTRDYDEAIRAIPIERLLSETDAPYVTPVPYRGKRNEPRYVVEVVKKIAEIKKLPFEVVRKQLLKNTEAVFGFCIP